MILSDTSGKFRCFECNEEIKGTYLSYTSHNRQKEMVLHTWCAATLGGKLVRMTRNHFKRLETQIYEGVH